MDEYDNKSVGNRTEQLSKLMDVRIAELLLAYCDYLAVAKLLRHEDPEEFNIVKLRTIEDCREGITKKEHQQIISAFLFDTI